MVLENEGSIRGCIDCGAEEGCGTKGYASEVPMPLNRAQMLGVVWYLTTTVQ